jgi:hypothetical protein
VTVEEVPIYEQGHLLFLSALSLLAAGIKEASLAFQLLATVVVLWLTMVLVEVPMEQHLVQEMEEERRLVQDWVEQEVPSFLPL